jgi:hypothetical protein
MKRVNKMKQSFSEFMERNHFTARIGRYALTEHVTGLRLSCFRGCILADFFGFVSVVQDPFGFIDSALMLLAAKEHGR